MTTECSHDFKNQHCIHCGEAKQRVRCRGCMKFGSILDEFLNPETGLCSECSKPVSGRTYNLGTTPAAHPDQRWGCISYSQHGEDLMLLNVFHILGIQKPSYLDVGAHHPSIISNTKLLYDRGSRGYHVDANPLLEKPFVLERPDEPFYALGVGPIAGRQTFHFYSDTSGRNTFSQHEVDSLQGILEVQRTAEIEVVTLDHLVRNILKLDHYPDLLSLDIEGLDAEVLATTDFKWSAPKVILVETRPENVAELRRVMVEKGFMAYCITGENIFFIEVDSFLKITRAMGAV